MIFSTISFVALTGTPNGAVWIMSWDGRYWSAQVFASIVMLACCLLISEGKIMTRL